MAKRKEFFMVFVDVAPHMHPWLPEVEDWLFSFVEAKLLNKPDHEVAIVLLGTSGTSNELHTENEEQGDDQQYLNIEVLRNFRVPNMEGLEQCRNLPRGQGMCDLTDGFFVGIDMFIKLDKERKIGKMPQHMIIISNLFGQGKGYDPAATEPLLENLKMHAVHAEALVLNYPHAHSDVDAHQDTQASSVAIQADNMDFLTGLLDKLPAPGPQLITSKAALAAAVRWTEVAPVSTFRGDLRIGQSMFIKVRTYKKVAHEKPPTLKPYMTFPAAGAAGGAGPISPSIQRTGGVISAPGYHVEGHPDQLVAQHELVNGYRYGNQSVPIPEEMERGLKFSVRDKGMWLWGWVDAVDVPRQYFIGESLVVVPETNDAASGPAVGALVQAMVSLNKVAVVRLVARDNYAPKMYVLSPQVGTPALSTGLTQAVGSMDPSTALDVPYHWVANQLPFEQDVKWVDFPALALRPALQPSIEQLVAADDLVKSMELISGGQELVSPSSTANPTLHMFYQAVGRRALDRAAQLGAAEEDVLVKAAFTVPESILEASEAACKRMAEVFPTKLTAKAVDLDSSKRVRALFGADAEALLGKGEGAPAGAEEGEEEGGVAAAAVAAAAVTGVPSHLLPGVGLTAPEADFMALLQHPSRVMDAITGMCGVVVTLVEQSVGVRNYARGTTCVGLVRRACVNHSLPAPFNALLKELEIKFRAHEAHAQFFAQLLVEGTAPISAAEAPGGAGADVVHQWQRLVEDLSRTASTPASQPVKSGLSSLVMGATAGGEVSICISSDDEFAGME